MYEYMYVTYSRLNRNTIGQIKCDIIATRMIKPLKGIQRSQKGVPKLSVIELLEQAYKMSMILKHWLFLSGPL